MARDFPDTGSDHMSMASGALSVNVGTLVGWWQLDFAPTDSFDGYFFDSDTARHAFYFNSGGDGFAMYNDARYTPFNSLSWTTGAWLHIAFLFNKTGNVQRLFLDGVEQTGGTPSGTWGSNALGTNVHLNARFNNTQHNNCRTAEVAIYGSVLADAHIVALARGVNPLRIGVAPRAYYPIFGVASPEPDYGGGGYNGTLTGTAVADHPPVQPPFGFDEEWQGAFTAGGAPAAGQPTMRRWGGTPGMTYSGHANW